MSQMSEDELKSILKNKREQISEEKQLKQEQVKRAREKEKQREKEKSQILRSILSRKARERLARIKMAKPELGQLIENQLILLSQRGGIEGRISDERFKELLKRINQRRSEEKETKIKFKRKGTLSK